MMRTLITAAGWMKLKRCAKILELNSASPDFVVDSNIVTTFQLEHQMNITNEI